jgi:predicted ATPase
MRLARQQDHWRRIEKRNYPSRIDKLSYNGVLGIGAGVISFEKGITAVCGTNGVGKSTVLNCIWGALTNDNLNSTKTARIRLTDATLTAAITHNNNSRDCVRRWQGGVANHSAPDPELSIIRIDPFRSSYELAKLFREITNVQELLASVEPREANEDELSLLSLILGRKYTSWLIYEVELDPDSGTQPYFEVEADGVSYRLETMGDGEIAVMSMIWAVSSAPNSSVITIDEPESLIPPRSQRCLMDYFAKSSDEKGLWIIVATHSPAVLDHLPPEHVWRVVKCGPNVNLIRATNSIDILADLGIVPPKTVVLVTEDCFSREFVLAILLDNDFALAQQTVVIQADGTEGVKNSLLYTPRFPSLPNIVGVLDGDQRNKTKGFPPPFVFLPGELAPEIPLIDGIEGDLSVFANKLGIAEDVVRDVVARHQGLNHHDWSIEIAKDLSIHVNLVVRALYGRWASKPDNKTEIIKFIGELHAALGV